MYVIFVIIVDTIAFSPVLLESNPPSPSKLSWGGIMGQERQRSLDVAELQDYGGQFDPQFTHYNFTKETLLNLLEAYSGYMRNSDDLWYSKIRGLWGNDVAIEYGASVGQEALLYELRVITSLLDVHGDDVATVMKYFQVTPWMWGRRYEIDLKNNDHGILTCHYCPSLSALEKEGTGHERLVCGEMDSRNHAYFAHYFNPNIKVTGLKVPPRTNYNDCCCQWEFKLEE